MLFKSMHQVILERNDQIISEDSPCQQYFRCSMRPYVSVYGQFSLSRTLAVRYENTNFVLFKKVQG